MTVVADEPERLVLYRPTGAPYRSLRSDDGGPLPRGLSPDTVHALSGRTADGTWQGGPVLFLTPTGAEHTVILNWTPAWEFNRWYVNLQQPTVRTADGVQTTDEYLDIVVRPDHSWEWKDEEQLDRAVAGSWITAERAQAARREGERVVEDIDAGRTPFDGRWLDWRPDPAWPMPAFPEERAQR